MKKQFIKGTSINYTFFNKEGIAVIAVSIALTTAALLLQKKAYFNGLEDAKEIIGIK